MTMCRVAGVANMVIYCHRAALNPEVVFLEPDHQSESRARGFLACPTMAGADKSGCGIAAILDGAAKAGTL